MLAFKRDYKQGTGRHAVCVTLGQGMAEIHGHEEKNTLVFLSSNVPRKHKIPKTGELEHQATYSLTLVPVINHTAV